jgi:hypothetical protein
MMKGRFQSRRLAVVCAVILALGACESSERIAPEGSTVTVAGTPATIVLGSSAECLSLLNVTECGTSQIVATVSSKLGVPLPEQDVRFTSTAGLLFTGTISSPDPLLNEPVQTDDFGNAVVNLITSTTTTVTGRSGAASGMATLNTVAGNLSRITLIVDTISAGCTMSTDDVTSCSQTICFEAKAEESDGTGIDGVSVAFELRNNTVGENTFDGNFTPQVRTTSSGGFSRTSFTPDSTCPAECGMNKSCEAEVVAFVQGGGFESNHVVLQIGIP